MNIFDAIEDHNLQQLEKLLAEGVNPNKRAKSNRKMWHIR